MSMSAIADLVMQTMEFVQTHLAPSDARVPMDSLVTDLLAEVKITCIVSCMVNMTQ